MSKNNKLINFSDIHLQMIEDLKNQTGMKTMTAIVHAALAALHKSYFPAYRANISSGPQTEEEAISKAKIKAKANKALKDEEELLRLQPKIDICVNGLKGSVEVDEKGYRYCVFTQFRSNASEDARQKLPLKAVDPIMIENSLFMPSKYRVLRDRPELLKKYKDFKIED